MVGARWEDGNKETGNQESFGFLFLIAQYWVKWVLNQIWNLFRFPAAAITGRIWLHVSGMLELEQHLYSAHDTFHWRGATHTLQCTDPTTVTTFPSGLERRLSFSWLVSKIFSILSDFESTYHLNSTVKSIEVLRIVLSHYRRKIETISSLSFHTALRQTGWWGLCWPDSWCGPWLGLATTTTTSVTRQSSVDWFQWITYPSETAHKCGFLVYAIQLFIFRLIFLSPISKARGKEEQFETIPMRFHSLLNHLCLWGSWTYVFGYILHLPKRINWN